MKSPSALELASRLEKHHSVFADDSAATMLRKQHEAIRVMREALETLSLLGNGPHPGNSIGNLIAQKALKDTENI